MIASAPATWAIASMRAVCTRFNPRAVARRSRPSFHCRASWSVQNSAWVVWSAVRTLLTAPPIAWISFTSRAYAGLASAKGGPGRNCDALRRTSGRTPGRRRPATGGGVVAGGTAGFGCQTPGPGAGGLRSEIAGLRSRPSFARHASTARAMILPIAVPAFFAGPFGSAARYAA